MKRFALLSLFLLPLCAHANSTTDDMAIGAVTSLAGAAVGQQFNSPLIGAAVGGAVGGAIINKRHQPSYAPTVTGYTSTAGYVEPAGYDTDHGHWGHHDRGLHRGWYIGRGNRYHHHDED